MCPFQSGQAAHLSMVCDTFPANQKLGVSIQWISLWFPAQLEALISWTIAVNSSIFAMYTANMVKINVCEFQSQPLCSFLEIGKPLMCNTLYKICPQNSYFMLPSFICKTFSDTMPDVKLGTHLQNSSGNGYAKFSRDLFTTHWVNTLLLGHSHSRDPYFKCKNFTAFFWHRWSQGKPSNRSEVATPNGKNCRALRTIPVWM